MNFRRNCLDSRCIFWGFGPKLRYASTIGCRMRRSIEELFFLFLLFVKGVIIKGLDFSLPLKLWIGAKAFQAFARQFDAQTKLTQSPTNPRLVQPTFLASFCVCFVNSMKLLIDTMVALPAFGMEIMLSKANRQLALEMSFLPHSPVSETEGFGVFGRDAAEVSFNGNKIFSL